MLVVLIRWGNSVAMLGIPVQYDDAVLLLCLLVKLK